VGNTARFAYSPVCRPGPGEGTSMGADWRDSQIRYLVHFDDGGSGMRYRSEPLPIGNELADGGSRYRVERLEPPPNPNAFGHAWVTAGRREA
jgi:hypothetical protein